MSFNRSGSGFMNRYQMIIKKRNERQLARLDELAESVRKLAKKKNANVRFYGSYARRKVHPGSDLDVLIVDDLDSERRNEIMTEIEDLASEHRIAVDIVEATDAPHLEKGSIT